MRWHTLFSRWRQVGRARQSDRDLRTEIDAHLEEATEDLVRQGLPAADARLAARRRFGNVAYVEETFRDVRGHRLDDLARDTRYGLRLLRRHPGFTIVAILSLALGIGANTAIFSLVNTVLLRAVPVQRPGELVFLQSAGTAGTSGSPPYPCFERLRDQVASFSGMAAFATDHLSVEIGGTVEQVFGQVASGSYFEVLGVRPAAGRLMTAADDRLDPAVAVIGYSYWQRKFGGAPDAIGRTLSFRSRTYTIVGVTPADFWGLEPGRNVDVTLPITLERDLIASRSAWWFETVARLRPEASVDQATAQTDAVFQSFMNEVPQSAGARSEAFDHMVLTPAARGLGGLRSRFTAPLYALLAVAGLVLLIACANLGTLLLVRGAAREREFAIRLATGAEPGRLVRQLLTESLVLFVLAGVVGVGVARLSIEALTRFVTIGRNPIVLPSEIDWQVGLFAAGVALAAGLLTGLWPAWRSLGVDVQTAMKAGEARVTGSRRFGLTARLLVVGQVAVSLVLLITAVAFVRTMENLRGVELGFAERGVLTMSLDPVLPKNGQEGAARVQFWDDTLARVRARPDIQSASLSLFTPLSGRDTGKRISVPGFQPRSDRERAIHVNHVSEDYFRTFSITLLSGRLLTQADANVVVVNEAAAETYYPGRNPVGETLDFGNSRIYRVVGVVRDAKHQSLREVAPRFAFVPLRRPLDPLSRVTLAVSSDRPTAAVARAIESDVRAVHANTLVSEVIGIEEQINATLMTERLLSTLASVFAALAVGLAAIGLYGILSQSVVERRSEFGVRLALGARPLQLGWAVYRGMLIQVGAGMALGLPVAVLATRAGADLLFGITPADPGTYALGGAVLALAAGLAGWFPARRASAIDPAETLR